MKMVCPNIDQKRQNCCFTAQIYLNQSAYYRMKEAFHLVDHKLTFQVLLFQPQALV